MCIRDRVADVLDRVLDALFTLFALPGRGMRLDREVAVIAVLVQDREEGAPVDRVDAGRRVVVPAAVLLERFLEFVGKLRVAGKDLADLPVLRLARRAALNDALDVAVLETVAPAAVSYTHLDVYKRQVENTPQIAAPAELLHLVES